MLKNLSSRQLARAIGVSESSIKRWADDGTIHAARTAGGHRRIPLPEAVRFIRAGRHPVAHPEILGLPDLGAVQAGAQACEGTQLFDFLAAGAVAPARGLVLSMYLGGSGAAAIIDGPIREAMRAVGELWRHDPAGVFVEHRATDICMQCITQLRALIPAAAEAPRAVGGAPAGDTYVLPSLAAAAVLGAEGFEAVNLGPDVPFETMAVAVDRLRPSLVWIAASVTQDPPTFVRRLEAFALDVQARGVSVMVGGQALEGLGLPSAPNLHVGRSMAELAAFARGLRAGLPTHVRPSSDARPPRTR